MSGVLRGFLVISLLLIEYVLNRIIAIVILHGARNPSGQTKVTTIGEYNMALVLKDWHGYTHDGLGSQGGI